MLTTCSSTVGSVSNDSSSGIFSVSESQVCSRMLSSSRDAEDLSQPANQTRTFAAVNMKCRTSRVGEPSQSKPLVCKVVRRRVLARNHPSPAFGDPSVAWTMKPALCTCGKDTVTREIAPLYVEECSTASAQTQASSISRLSDHSSFRNNHVNRRSRSPSPGLA